MTEKKILILGGAGYLGNAITRRFRENIHCKITVGDPAEPIRTGKEAFQKTDVLEKAGLDKIISQNDLIINCTGQITHPINACYRINTEGALNISEAVKRHNKRLLQISTVAVYGTSRYADEKSAVNPESPYSACKSFAEFIVRKTLEENSLILRLPNLYGDKPHKGLFPYLIRSYLSDRKLNFDNDGSLSRYFLHVRDCAEAVFLAVEHDLTGIYNVPAPEKYTLKEIIHQIESMMKVKFETIFRETAPIDNIDQLSFDAFREATGFNPEKRIRDYLTDSFPSHE